MKAMWGLQLQVKEDVPEGSCCGTRVCVCMCVTVVSDVCVCVSLKITFVPFSSFSRAGPIAAGSVLELPGQRACTGVDVMKCSS